MPRIDILTAYFPPQNSAGANRLASFARGLAKAGWDVRTCAARFQDGSSLLNDDIDLQGTTNWIDVRAPSRDSGFIARFISEWKVASEVYRRARRGPESLKIITTPFLSFLLIAPWYMRAEKWVADVRDLTWEYRISESFTVRSAQKLLKIWSLFALSRASLIITSTTKERDYIARNLPRKRVEHIANGIELHILRALSSATQHPADRGSRPANPVIVYAGTIGKAQGVSILTKAAPLTSAARYRIVGEGAEMAEISARIAEEGIVNVELTGRMSRDRVFAEYEKANALFLRLGRGFDTAVPSKAYEYLATGKPLIYMGTRSDATYQLLQGFAGVYFVEDDDVAGLVHIVETFTHLDRGSTEGNISSLLEYTRENQVEKLRKVLESLDDSE